MRERTQGAGGRAFGKESERAGDEGIVWARSPPPPLLSPPLKATAGNGTEQNRMDRAFARKCSLARAVLEPPARDKPSGGHATYALYYNVCAGTLVGCLLQNLYIYERTR